MKMLFFWPKVFKNCRKDQRTKLENAVINLLRKEQGYDWKRRAKRSKKKSKRELMKLNGLDMWAEKENSPLVLGLPSGLAECGQRV